MTLVAFAAVILRWPDLGSFAIPPAALLVSRARGRIGLVLGAVYLPCLRGFFTDCSHCRETWLRLFPITPTLAPGVLAEKLLGVGRLPDRAEFAIAALALCGLLVALAWIGGRGRVGLLVAAAIGLVWSGVWATVLLAAIRA
jgi:hypothetical protein